MVYDRRGAKDEQEYVTDPELADALCRVAAAHVAAEGHRPLFVDLGVGDGAIYDALPAPKQGVELRALLADRRRAGVVYGRDALGWAPAPPPQLPPDVCVVCNPPFAKQVAFFNHAAEAFAPGGELLVCWLVGLNVRLWTIEDQLDDRMHLVGEWLVPPRLSRFRVGRRDDASAVAIKTAVQVWRRGPAGAPRRARWGLPRALPGFRPVYAEPCPDGALVVSRTANATQLGKAGVLGATAWRDGDRHFALTDEAVAALGGGATANLGTLRKGNGTSLVLAHPDAREAGRCAARLAELRADGAIRDLFATRTSLTIGALSIPVLAHLMRHPPQTLARPIEYLDGVRRHARQW
jgi:hypothetical protein